MPGCTAKDGRHPVIYRPFAQQREVLLDKSSRVKVLAAGKRSGKSEVAYIDDIIAADTQPGYTDNGIDPYQVALIAPTDNMLRGLVWPKFRAFAKPFEREFKATVNEFYWNRNNSIVLGFSGEKITRMEGRKLHRAHLVEAFQLKKAVFLEAVARLSDSKGMMLIEGSLGPNFPNPRGHWIYQTFVDNKYEGARVWQWNTEDNPHFPQDELELARKNLDPRTYRQMYMIDWDVPGSALVYEQFEDANIVHGYTHDKARETYIVIDWGWAHRLVCKFYQYDRKQDTVYLFDEISETKLTLDGLWDKIKQKVAQHRIENVKDWACDIAGNQEREQTGRSNVQWFKDKHGIRLRYRSTAINYGIPIVRSYICNGLGQRRFLVDSRCKRSIDGLKRYSYPEKDGVILNENPVKKDDDEVDTDRYFFVNFLDPNRPKDSIESVNRWNLTTLR